MRANTFKPLLWLTFLIFVLFPGAVSATGVDARNTIVNTAVSQVGKPYILGADGPSAFDCSGLVLFCYNAANVNVWQADADWVAYPIDRGDALPGDLVYLDYEARPAYVYPTGFHVGIYIGNGEVIDARGSSSGVVRRSLTSTEWTWFGRIPAANWPGGDDGVTYSIGNRDFVTTLYRFLLDREPDSTGLAAWTASVDAGTPRWYIASQFLNSHDYHFAYAINQYSEILGRSDSGVGIASWVDAMDSGLSEREVRARLFGSDEYYINRCGSSDRAFAVSLYEKILGRSPGSGEEDGWIALFNSGQYTREGVARLFITTDEGLSSFITSTYVDTLLNPNQAGAVYWLRSMKAQAGENAVIAALLATDDFTGGMIDNKFYVSALYHVLLGRDPDASGLHNWTTAMNNGLTRYAVSTAFINSSESHQIMVRGLYSEILNRTADSPGLAAWSSLLDQGLSRRDVSISFYGSDEFFRFAGASQVQPFVSMLYQRMLGRIPTNGEESGWVAALNGPNPSLTRRETVAAIYNSLEHRRRYISGLYTSILGRSSVSLAGPEVSVWADAIGSGLTEETIEAAFYASLEFEPAP